MSNKVKESIEWNMSKVNKPLIGKVYNYTGHVYDKIFTPKDEKIESEFSYECRLILLDYSLDKSRYTEEKIHYWLKVLVGGKIKYCWLRNLDDFENHYKNIFEITNYTIPISYII